VNDVRRYVAVILGICFSLCLVAESQRTSENPEVPSNFSLDLETAARLRPRLIVESIAPAGRYAIGRLVFDKLVEQVAPNAKIAWQLRIVEDDELNAFSSPDGALFVESGLAKLAGTSTGLWAAILSHEMAHVLRRDWARRYLYQKYLENGRGDAIVLGDPSLPSASWSNEEKASADFGRFCRQMEIEADREGLMLMARAGYHPDFVPALHHLLHARGVGVRNPSLYAMHPCWEERDHELSHAYLAASIEFARRWPEWYASPGGNPPVVVFADQPTVRKIGAKEWQVLVAMRCQNLAGAVEVVLRNASAERKNSQALPDLPNSDDDLRQLTGCTSPKTTVTFTLAEVEESNARWTDVYVIDAWGAVLARADLPKLRH
jgi:hypothetical protein